LSFSFRLFGFAADPKWNDSKRFAVINADFNVLVYDFETGEAAKGHKGHENEVSILKKYKTLAQIDII
jgi:WD40 repeat protein